MKKGWLVCVVCVTALAWRASSQEDGSHRPADFQGDFASFDMVDADTGWAIGRADHTVSLLQTHDGGKSWTDISPKLIRADNIVSLSDAEEKLFCHLLDATHGWAAVEGDDNDPNSTETLYSTEDGGRTWKQNTFKSSVGSVVAVQFPDPDHGFILVEDEPASGKVRKATCRTVDGGKTWSESDADLPPEGSCEGMVFRNTTDGWVNGTTPREIEGTFFFRTKDGGKTWLPQSFEAPAGFEHGTTEISLPQFFGTQKNEGVVGVYFSLHDPDRGVYVFYHSRDGGEHWVSYGSIPEEPSDAAPSFLDENQGWMVADDTLFATADGGTKWWKVKGNLRFSDNESASQLRFINASVGWLVKEIEGEESRYELLRTTDGGRTWTHCCGPQGKLGKQK